MPRAPHPRRQPGRPIRRVLLAGSSAAAIVVASVIAVPIASALRPGHTAGVPTAIHGVVGLGDSVPSGTDCACTNYVTLVARSLAARQHLPVPVTNLAANGQTTSGLLAQRTEPATRQALARASVAIVTVGANDFNPHLIDDQPCRTPDSTGCYGSELTALEPGLQAVLDQIRGAMPPGAHVLVTGYWNVFRDGRVGAAEGTAYVANSDALTRTVNADLATAAAATGTDYVDLYTPFKGDGSRDDTPLLAPDGDHPNAAGHQMIATAVLEDVKKR